MFEEFLKRLKNHDDKLIAEFKREASAVPELRATAKIIFWAVVLGVSILLLVMAQAR